jgi:hypothetical protein
MDIHNYPIDLAVKVHDERARALLRERSVQRELRSIGLEQAGRRRRAGWTLRIVLAAPLMVGCACILLGWLLVQRG